MSFLKEIEKEWKEHRENHSDDYEWFECNNTDVEVNFNYAIGSEIVETDGTSIIFKTKKEAEEYGKKERAKYSGCSVCNRFQRLIIKYKKLIKNGGEK